ncbi:MAG: hypothetical protein AAGJ83_10175 [Planctomycetota bacterium]
MFASRGFLIIALLFGGAVFAAISDIGRGLIDHGDAGYHLRRSGPTITSYHEGRRVSRQRTGYQSQAVEGNKSPAKAKVHQNPFAE